MNVPAPALPLIERTITLTRALRNVANALLERAHQARSDGQLSLDDFFAVTDRYQTIINQANLACYEAAEHLPDIGQYLGPVEAATRELEQASALLAKVTDILAISGHLLTALSSLVLSILKPEPAAFAAVTAAVIAAAQGIKRQANH